MRQQIDLVMPVHNEGRSIAATLTEFYTVVQQHGGIDLRFVISEDGSTDDTVEVIEALSRTLPIKLLSDTRRKGYSRAVLDGFDACDAPLIAFVDSDGQCDPVDLFTLLNLIPDHDVVQGQRTPRIDHPIRIVMSALFRTLYRALFGIKLADPSCPYFILTQSAWQTLRTDTEWYLPQGLWWEFVARVVAHKLRFIAVPVAHRARKAGGSQVYHPEAMARIVTVHVLGLFRLKRELKRL